MSSLWFDLKDLSAFERALNCVEKVPQKVVTKAAGKGMSVVRRSVRGLVPVGETGNLKRSIIRKAERSRTKGKKVYDLMSDPGMNDLLQKPVAHPGAAGSTSTRGGHAYYPASMEYGFLTRSKGGGPSYVPGSHFMRQGATEADQAAKTAIIRAVTEELNKEWMQN